MMKTPNSNSASNHGEIRNTLTLLNQGEKKTVLDENNKNITLILGNTGDDKTTLVQWLATDGENLIAKESENESRDFIIVDVNRIGESTMSSKDLFHEMVLNRKFNTTYYDCPGFDDIQSTSHNIASTYFMKKVTDHAESVKLIFVISYPSVHMVINSESFTKLIRQATHLVQDIAKFHNSIAIIVTKVGNRYSKYGKNLVLESDEILIAEIAQFFEQVKEGFQTKLNSRGITDEEKTSYQKTITFIDILTKKDSNFYSRIGIFRKPDERGSLSNIQILKNEKQNIERIIEKELKFTPKKPNDFVYTFSQNSKNDINDLAKEINKNAWNIVDNIAQGMKQYIRDLLQQIRNKVKLFTARKQQTEVNLEEAQRFNTLITKCENATSELKNLSYTITVTELAKKINTSLNIIEINTLKDLVNNVATQGSYLDFLQQMNGQKFTITPRENCFIDVATNIEKFKQDIQYDINDVMSEILRHINTTMNIIATKIINQYHIRMRMMLRLEFSQRIDELKDSQHILNDIVQSANNQETWKEYWIKINNKLAQLKIDISTIKTDISDITNFFDYMTYLNYISSERSKISSLNFVDPFLNILRYINELTIWYEFLRDLQAKLSDNQIRKDVSTIDVSNINKGYANTSQSMMITFDNIQQFFDKIKPYNIMEYNSIKILQINEQQLQELNDLISFTLNNTVLYCTNDGTLMIKSDSFKFSEYDNMNLVIRNTQCANGIRINTIKMFATKEIIIDTDLQAIGHNLQLVIIAPKWIIKDKRTIVLDGASVVPANTNYRIKYWEFAQNDTLGSPGMDGKPGLPGGPAGNFFGIGQEFINGNSLIIIANGGTGGIGEDGENGSNGENGKPAHLNVGTFLSSSSDEESFLKYIDNYGYKNETQWTKWVYGTKGQAGGNGGNGGKGGIGGYEGNIRIIELGNSSSGITLFTNRGLSGRGGKGGYGGLGGINGEQTKVLYVPKVMASIITMRSDPCRATYGIDGNDDFNESGIIQPKIPLPPLNFISIIREYKDYLKDNINKNINDHSEFTQFYNELENNIQIKNIGIEALKTEPQLTSRSKRSVDKKLNMHSHTSLAAIRRVNPIPSFIPDRISYKQHNANTSELLNASTPLDWNSNLLFGQMLIAMKTGKNKTLSTNTFTSLEQKLNETIDELESNIIPIIESDQYGVSNEDEEEDNVDFQFT